MTPDMKRLVEAAAKCSEMPVCLDEIYNPAASDNPADYEAIVRAVLTELREVSDQMERAAESAGFSDEGRPNEPWVFQHQRMLDAILAEPATPYGIPSRSEP